MLQIDDAHLAKLEAEYEQQKNQALAQANLIQGAIITVRQMRLRLTQAEPVVVEATEEGHA